MVFPKTKDRVDDPTVVIPDSDRFPLDLLSFRDQVLVGSSQQDDAHLRKNADGVLSYMENELRVSLIRSVYDATFDVFPAILYDTFVFTGLNGSVLSVTAQSESQGAVTVPSTDYKVYPYFKNGAKQVRCDSLPGDTVQLTIRGTAGAKQADFPEALVQAAVLTFGYLVDRAAENRELMNSLYDSYRLA